MIEVKETFTIPTVNMKVRHSWTREKINITNATSVQRVFDTTNKIETHLLNYESASHCKSSTFMTIENYDNIEIPELNKSFKTPQEFLEFIKSNY